MNSLQKLFCIGMVCVSGLMSGTGQLSAQSIVDFNDADLGTFLEDPYIEDGVSMVVVGHPDDGFLGHYDINAGSPIDGTNFANIDDILGNSAVRFSFGGSGFDLTSIDFVNTGQTGLLTTSNGFELEITSIGGQMMFDGLEFEDITFFELSHTQGSFFAFDNVTLSSVPEPSTSLFLLLACVEPIMRRRR